MQYTVVLTALILASKKCTLCEVKMPRGPNLWKEKGLTLSSPLSPFQQAEKDLELAINLSGKHKGHHAPFCS